MWLNWNKQELQLILELQLCSLYHKEQMKFKYFDSNCIYICIWLTSSDYNIFPPFKVAAGQTVRTLEELSTQPVNNHRPIIVVNTAAEYESNITTH